MKSFIFLKDEINEINNLLVSNKIQKISILNHNDIFFEVNKNIVIHISLNFEKPFIQIIEKIPFKFETENNAFLVNTKKYLGNARILNVKQLNEDKIISFEFDKILENYDEIKIKLIIELFPNHPNFIIVDESNKILFSKHYSNINSYRLILNNLIYTCPEKKFIEFKYFIDDKYISTYLENIQKAYLKTKYIDIYKFVKNKNKQLIKKEHIINELIKESEKYQSYKDAGDYIYINLDNQNIDLSSFDIKIDKTLTSPTSIANYCYKRYKKLKKSIEINNEILIQINEEKKYIESLSIQLLNSNEDDLKEIYLELVKKGYLRQKTFNQKREIDSFNPYFIKINDTIIAFGKNNYQNDKLTFTIAKKDYYYFHVKDYSGSHVIIFSNKPNKETIKIAAELSLFLSHQDLGEVYIADVKDVKKANNIGKVNILKYKTITINSYDKDKINNLIISAERFSL